VWNYPDPITQDFMIIMPYYDSDMTHCINKLSWWDIFDKLQASMIGLKVLYDLILFTVIITMEFFLLLNMYKTSTAISDADDNDIYRIIPYVAPEIFQGKE
ncbi:12226_t:CDS:1, partial [Funneliformis geosporum]